MQSFVIPKPQVFPSQMWLKTSTFRLVLCERRTVCFAAALTVPVACWRAMMLLHRHHTMSSPKQSDDHRRPHLSVSSAVMGFSTFLLVLFWELALKIQSPVVFLWCSFRCYCKAENRRLKWISLIKVDWREQLPPLKGMKEPVYSRQETLGDLGLSLFSMIK